MIHYGDITKIEGFTLPRTDVVTGGSPCQDLSVAGKRAGLEGARSGLYMEQIRIIKEMRENDQLINGTEGADISPRYMVWENVPGAFSSNKGEDFRAVLEEAAKISDEAAVIPEPPKGKWHNSGAIVGDGWSIAWRVFDAQFWGVPQRRRRIYLVADFGGHTAGEILFKRDSLPGYPASSRIAGQGTAADSEGCPSAAGWVADGSGRRSGELVGVMSIEMRALERDQGNRMWEEVAPTMRASVNDNSPCHVLEPFVKSRRAKFPGDFETWVEGEVNPTLNNFDMGDVRTTTAVVEKEVFEWHNQDSRVTGPIDTACTLNTNAGGREGHLVMDAPVTLQMRSGKEGEGKGPLTQEDLSATLTAGNTQYLFEPEFGKPNQKAYGMSSYASNAMLSSNPHSGVYEAETSRTLDLNGGNPACNQGGIMIMDDRKFACPIDEGGTAFTLTATDHKSPQKVLSLNHINPIAIAARQVSMNVGDNLSPPILSTDYKDPTAVWTYQPVSGPLMANSHPGSYSGQDAHSDMFVTAQQSVRRLTPLECERLQGFPDGWTDIPDFVDGRGKTKTASDSARYKALGNSVALPNVYYVLYGIAEQMGFKGTLGSLFDGIGGFPLCWEALCGQGTALWASEIEDFPIAVTKHRFGED